MNYFIKMLCNIYEHEQNSLNLSNYKHRLKYVLKNKFNALRNESIEYKRLKNVRKIF